MSEIPFAATTPVSVGRVGLRARDGAALADYYKKILGLRELRRSGRVIGLGAGGRELLEIEESPVLREDDPRSAGLFHTAFLLPERADLARWVRYAIDERVPVTGASDHNVSEAIYLNDPEGNGIEIYTDRPRETWQWEEGRLRMGTEALNVQGLLAELGVGDAGWKGAPENSVVGHVHLRVGNPAEAERWWNDELGFDTMVHYGESAVFLSSGGYHHHIAANSWQSSGAGPRENDRTGLSFVELAAKDAAKSASYSDPWGNEIRVQPVKA
ncbi:VOC family protein [Aquamicrobium sp. LC103]|uniref:VOC family protein n=1 Tax=Aquamicrobium sp. LC103 TaxID=1120658 RepID=UPI00063E9B07|nr:VOC family protein [Aquamicrobium sp. LC103]TKT76915.1 VOC family protein [Aquamicrobium sp. LC103]